MSTFLAAAIVLSVLGCSAAQAQYPSCLQSVAQNPPGLCPTWQWYITLSVIVEVTKTLMLLSLSVKFQHNFSEETTV